jgi:hypothetical protein
MDLDYRALSNAGLWCVGRLQTDADRERVLDGLGDTSGQDGGFSKAELANVVKKLALVALLLALHNHLLGLLERNSIVDRASDDLS